MVPSREIEMLRGDWLIEALTAIARNQAKWEPMPANHTNPNAPPGRFHAPTQQYWQDAREDPGIPRPMFMTIRIPAEPGVQYPGETLWVTPTWVREVHQAFRDAGVMYAFDVYTRNDSATSIAYYDKQTKQVRWGLHPNAIRRAALIVSDYTDYQPN